MCSHSLAKISVEMIYLAVNMEGLSFSRGASFHNLLMVRTSQRVILQPKFTMIFAEALQQ